MANSYNFYISKGFDHEAALYFANGKRSIKSIFANDDYTLTITFDNDEKRILDMKADLQKGIFKAFQNLKDFKRVYLDVGGSNTMYVINDIAYAGKPKAIIRVKSVRPLGDYQLWLRFSDNEIKRFDFKPLLELPCYQPLKDKKIFDDVYLDYGVPVWNDGEIDIAPETLYFDGIPEKNNDFMVEG